MLESSRESNTDNLIPHDAMQNLVELQAKQHQLQAHIMALLAEQRHDLDTITKTADSMRYTVKETPIDDGVGCLVW